MSKAALLADVAQYVGHAIIECEAAIKEAAEKNRFTVNVMDPDFNTNPIMKDDSRLNVRTNRDGVVLSFSVG